VFPWISMYYLCFDANPRLLFHPEKKHQETMYISNSKKIYSIFNSTVTRLRDDDGLNHLELYESVFNDLVMIESIITKNTIMKTPATQVVFIGDTTNQSILFKNTSEPYDVLCFYESLVGLYSDDYFKLINTPPHIRSVISFFRNAFSSCKDIDAYIELTKSIRNRLK
jgi:hypothetical protein